jgi:hypothetical protein
VVAIRSPPVKTLTVRVCLVVPSASKRWSAGSSSWSRTQSTNQGARAADPVRSGERPGRSPSGAPAALAPAAGDRWPCRCMRASTCARLALAAAGWSNGLEAAGARTRPASSAACGSVSRSAEVEK